GEPRWEQQYRAREPELTSIVDEARRIAPDVFLTPAAKMAAAVDAKRDQVEDAVFARVREDDREAARVLLASADYAHYRKEHARCLVKIMTDLRTRNVANVGRHRRNAYLGATELFVAVPLMVAMWLGIGGIIRGRVRERDKAERMLRDGLAFYTSLTESMNQGIFVLDRDFHYRLWNAAMERMFQVPRDRLIGTGVQPWDVFAHVREQGLEAALRRAMSGQVAERDGICCTLADGSELYTAQTYMPLRSNGGPPSGVLAIVRDVTEARRAAAALRDSERLFRTTFEQAAVGMAHIAPDGRFLKVNQRLCEMLGYSRQELLDKRVEDIAPPDRAEKDLAQTRRLLAGEIDTYSIETRCTRADGSDIWVLATVSVLRDENGAPLYFVDIVQDLSDRRRAEQEIVSLARFPQENPSPVLRISADGTILYGNQASDPLLEMCGCHRGGPIHGPCRQFVADALETGRAAEEEMQCGETTFLLSFVPVLEAGYVNVYAGDITGRRRAEEERRKLESQVQYAQKLESLGVLAGGIAHDFNNLLVAILGNADLALRDSPPESPVRPGLEAIKRAAIRASDLTNQMLAYSGRGRLVVEHLDLNRLVEEMAHLLKVSIAKNVTLTFDLAEGLPPVEADAAQLRQVVMNLITNASEAIGAEQGTVKVSTGVMEADRAYLDQAHLAREIPEGQYVYVDVADTGCGMDEETMAKLFDPFFTTKFTGRGLGLAAALGIVRGHRGAIWVESQVGVGSTLRVLLPGVEVAPGAPTKPEPEEAPETWRGEGTVLVIDDEEGVRTVARSMLERLGYEVVTAADGAEGLAEYRKRPDQVALVLLDMTMPRLGGEETLREIRRIRPDAKVILTSGYPEEDAAKRFAGMGLAGFIQKPFGLSDVVAKLRRALEF
ncbi:MAG: PAS domain-containing hybrid sensor histidine kinase/response regulator, partial [Planctomycetota bacterium]